MPENICFVCNSSATISVDINNLRKIVSCPRCKKYEIDRRTADRILDKGLSEQQIANISSWIYHNAKPIIDQNNIENLLNLPTPTVGEKARRFLTYVVKQYPKPGFYIKYIRADDSLYLTITGCYDKTELGYIVKDYLVDNKKFLINFTDSENLYRFVISPEGWAYIESLKELNPDSQIGFIAMSFADKFNHLYEDGLKKGILNAGYEPIRLDRTEHNNKIDDEIISTIKRSKFLVADCTEQNRGVYFEAGYALGLGLQVIWVCKKAELDENRVHVDTRQYFFIDWEEGKWETLIKRLSERIIATIGKGSYNP